MDILFHGTVQIINASNLRELRPCSNMKALVFVTWDNQNYNHVHDICKENYFLASYRKKKVIEKKTCKVL